jgi:hypothetical protein
MDEKLLDILDRHWEKLREYPNVLSVGLSKKFVKGVDTGRDSITVFVSSKKPKKLLSKKDILPSELDGVPVDVVELSTSDWEIGETEVSRKPPSVQRRIVGGVKK